MRSLFALRTPPFPRSAPRLLALAALLALATAPAAEARKSKIARGTEMRLSGVVTGPDGTVVGDVRVMLESSTWEFRVLKMRRERQETHWLATRSNARGEYTLRWPWSGDHNRFFLVVAVPMRNAEGDYMHELLREEITERVQLGSPVVVPLVLPELDVLTAFRAFEAELDSDDEKEIYQREGRPDRVHTAPGPEGSETTWWYFEAGKLYRFRDGDLVTTEPFDPVREF